MRTAHIHTDTPTTHTYTCTVQTHSKHQNLRYVYSSHPHWHTHNTRVQLKLTANTKTSGMCTNRIHTDTPTTHTPHTRHTYTTNRQAGVLHPNRTSDTFTKHVHNTHFWVLPIPGRQNSSCVYNTYTVTCVTPVKWQQFNQDWICDTLSYVVLRRGTQSVALPHSAKHTSITHTLVPYHFYKPKNLKHAPVQYIEYNSIQFNSIQFIDQLRALKGQQENCTQMNKQYAQ